MLWHFANGRNADAVTPEPAENKGYSNATTTAHDVVTREEGCQVLLSLCEDVYKRQRFGSARQALPPRGTIVIGRSCKCKSSH